MDSIGEDVIGWWAKAGWQDGLGKKLSLDETFSTTDAPVTNDENEATETVDFSTISTTWTSNLTHNTKSKLVIPPILAYVHPSKPSGKATPSLIRRVDTGPLLLAISLQLAKLKSIEELSEGETASPLAHQRKVAYPEGIAQRTTVTRPDCLLAENVIVEEKSAIKECVIGANCHIKTGAKLNRCVLMDGVVVGKGCKLTNCILGRRSEIGEDSVLTDCEVQENLLVPAKSMYPVP
jgi:translation initiation factor eIF-2B subunit gamma